jgi:hypothetical protein
MSIYLIFLVRDEICPCPYSKMYSKMKIIKFFFYRTKYDIIYYDQNCIFVVGAHAAIALQYPYDDIFYLKK